MIKWLIINLVEDLCLRQDLQVLSCPNQKLLIQKILSINSRKFRMEIFRNSENLIKQCCQVEENTTPMNRS